MFKEQCFAEQEAKLKFCQKDDLLQIINDSKENALLKAVALDKLLKLKIKWKDLGLSFITFKKYEKIKYLPEQCILLYRNSFYKQQKGLLNIKGQQKNVFNTTHLTEMTRFLDYQNSESLILNMTVVILENKIKSSETIQWCDFISKNSYSGQLTAALCSQTGYEYHKIIGNASLQNNDLWNDAQKFTRTKTFEQWFMYKLSFHQQKLLVEKMIYETIYMKQLLFCEQKLYQLYQDYFCYNKNYELESPATSASKDIEKELVIDLSAPSASLTKTKSDAVSSISQPSTSKVSSKPCQQNILLQALTRGETSPSEINATVAKATNLNLTIPNIVSLKTLANEVAKIFTEIVTPTINNDTTTEIDVPSSSLQIFSQLVFPSTSVLEEKIPFEGFLIEQKLQTYSKRQLLTIIRDNKENVLSKAIALTILQERGVTNEEIGWQEATIKNYILIKQLPEKCHKLYLQYYQNADNSKFIFTADHLCKLTIFLLYRQYEQIINEITDEIISKELNVKEVEQWCKYLVKKIEDNEDYVLDTLYTGKQYDYFKNITNFTLKKYTLWDEACFTKQSKVNIASWFSNDLNFQEQKELVEMTIYHIEENEHVKTEHKKIVRSLHKKYCNYYCGSNETTQIVQQVNDKKESEQVRETEVKIAVKIDKIISLLVANKNNDTENTITSISDNSIVVFPTPTIEQISITSKRKNDNLVKKSNIIEKKQKINIDDINKNNNDFWESYLAEISMTKTQPYSNKLSLLKKDSLLESKQKLQMYDKELLLNIIRNKYKNPILKMLAIQQLKNLNVPLNKIGWYPLTIKKYELVSYLPDKSLSLFYQAIESEEGTRSFFKLKHLVAVASLLKYPNSHETINKITEKIIKDKLDDKQTIALCKVVANTLVGKNIDVSIKYGANNRFENIGNNSCSFSSATSNLTTQQLVPSTEMNWDLFETNEGIPPTIASSANTIFVEPTMLNQNKISDYGSDNSLLLPSTSKLPTKEPPTNTEMNWDLFETNEVIPPTIASPAGTTFIEPRLATKLTSSTNTFENEKEQINKVTEQTSAINLTININQAKQL